MSHTFNYRERAELFGAFMLDLEVQFDRTELLNVMCCINTRTFEAYLSDINIHIKRTHQNHIISTSMIANDRQWLKMKVELVWKRLKELSNSRT